MLDSHNDGRYAEVEVKLEDPEFDLPDNLESRSQTPILAQNGRVKSSSGFIPRSLIGIHCESSTREPIPPSGQESNAVNSADVASSLLWGSRTLPAIQTTRPPTPLMDINTVTSPPRPSFLSWPSISSTPVTESMAVIDTGSKNKEQSNGKKKGGGRKTEPRRVQNMVAQKRYRDKRLHVTALMSESLIQIEVALRGLERETPEECLNRIKYFMDEYKVEMNTLDPAFLVKQDEAVNDQDF